ncbi:MAG: DUF3394 domain-containing protein [Sneathiella sp.]|nr:DUF3394 domain-containing protein [Sneathiella sp.]
MDGHGCAAFINTAPSKIVQAIEEAPTGSELRLIVDGEDDIGDPITITAILPITADGSGQERLEALGLELLIEGDDVIIDNAAFDSPAQAAGLDFDQKIKTVLVPADQPSKAWMYIPAMFLLGLICLIQRRRNGVADSQTVTV